MKIKTLAIAISFMVLSTSACPIAYAHGAQPAMSSLLLPTTGQAMNGQISNTKTKIMAGVEVAAVTTVVVLGLATGGAVIWAGLGPLIANHAWSSADAYSGAQGNLDPTVELQLSEAQKTLEFSRQRRMERQRGVVQTDKRGFVTQNGEFIYYPEKS